VVFLVVTDYLVGRLVRLRALEPEDEPSLHAWINDAVVTEYLAARYPFSHHQERDFVGDGASTFTGARFAVIALDEGGVIGTVGLPDARPESRTATLAIMIGDRSYWDRGYGTDTVRVVCRFGFEMMNLHRIELDVFAGNERAIRVYEHAGFQREGLRRQAIFKAGRYHDIIAMGLLRDEFRWQ
jgi:RimJ/RimL family protein N-acetyltransferase